MKIRAEPQGSYFIGICAGATPEKGRKSGNNHLILHQCGGNSSGVLD